MKVLRDAHPGRWQEGIELNPVLVYAPGYDAEEPMIQSGLQLGDVIEAGMFRDWIQPIQVITPLDDDLENCIFTMSNIGTITNDQIEILKKEGRCLVNADPYYWIEVFINE